MTRTVGGDFGALRTSVAGVVLLPVKLLALLAMAKGHVRWGGSVFALAKAGGAVIVRGCAREMIWERGN